MDSNKGFIYRVSIKAVRCISCQYKHFKAALFSSLLTCLCISALPSQQHFPPSKYASAPQEL